MNKDERMIKSFVKSCCTIASIVILSYNTNAIGFCNPSTTYEKAYDYSPFPDLAAMNAITYPNGSFDIFIARYFYNNDIDESGIEVSTWNSTRGCIFRQEAFGFGNGIRPCAPAICINRVDEIPQIITKRDLYGDRMIHYWRDPNGYNATWVEQQVLNTSCQGSPAMISNLIAPNNLEVVYRDGSGNLRHLWRETGNVWHEDGTLLPLPSNFSNYHVSSDPVMTQTADGNIHVAAKIATIDDNDDELAYWVRESHNPVWHQAAVYSGDYMYHSNTRPVIVALPRPGNGEKPHVLVFCQYGSVSCRGYKSTDESSPEHPGITDYADYYCELYIPSRHLPHYRGGDIHNWSGTSALLNGDRGYICLGFTEFYNGLTGNFLINIGASPY